MNSSLSRNHVLFLGVLYFIGITILYWLGVAYLNLSLTHGHLVWGDGFFYYEYLPSLLSDHPLNFCSSREALIAKGIPYNLSLIHI